MLIGLNLLYLVPGEVGGTEVYAKHLIHALVAAPDGNRFLVFVNQEGREWPLPESECIQQIVCPINARKRFARYWFEQVHLPSLVKAHGVELLHSAGYVGPIVSPCPHVITLHDVNFIGHGNAMSLPKRLLLGSAVLASTHACDHIITVSEFSKREAIKHLKLPEAKITAVYSAAGLHTFDAVNLLTAAPVRPASAPAHYLLTLSSQSKHKNLLRLICAFSRIKERIPHHLVIAGHRPHDPAFEGLISDAGLKTRVQVTGYLDDASLREYMASADLFVFPSMYEGFGLPALEAQALGTPMACSERASLPEVAGKGAAYFNPESEEDIASTILRVLQSQELAKSLIAAGYENARRFSWAKTASETLQVYRKVASQNTIPQHN